MAWRVKQKDDPGARGGFFKTCFYCLLVFLMFLDEMLTTYGDSFLTNHQNHQGISHRASPGIYFCLAWKRNYDCFAAQIWIKLWIKNGVITMFCMFCSFYPPAGYDDISDCIDLIICLGGDGTLLYASSLFQVIPFLLVGHYVQTVLKVFENLIPNR